MNINKKRAITILILLLIVGLFSSATTSTFFTKSVIITRIFPHSMGYKIFYMSNDLKLKEVYLPGSLFTNERAEGLGKSIINYGYGQSYPYMTIYWNGGEFSHVKLFLKKDFNDITWGAFNNPNDHDENFKNATLKFYF